MKEKELLDKVTHVVAVNWIIENVQIKDAERFMADTVRQTLARAVDSLLNDDADLSVIADEMARDVLLNCRIQFAEKGKTVASSVACIVLISTAWLVFQLHKVAATELAMRLFGNAADDDGTYYDSMDFMTLLSPYEKDGGKVMAEFMESRRMPRKDDMRQRLLKAVMDDTQGLQPVLNKKWSLWQKLWAKILENDDMLTLLNRAEPYTKPLGDINAKMICNVLGIVKDKLRITTSYDDLSNAICPEHSLKNYILKHSCDSKGMSTSECVFDRADCDFIENIISKLQQTKNQSVRK